MNGSPSQGDPLSGFIYLVFLVYSILALYKAQGWRRKCQTVLVIIGFIAAGLVIALLITLALGNGPAYFGFFGSLLGILLGAIGAVTMHSRNKKEDNARTTRRL